MGNVSRSFYNDLKAARQAQAQDAKQVRIVRLTKAGKPSKMADDTKYFATVAEANAYIERIKALNPNSHIEYAFI